ncbi:MAG: lysylphosphatidylglycerol synthase transmembrane domain-containing protein [Acidobacteriota bacterium]
MINSISEQKAGTEQTSLGWLGTIAKVAISIGLLALVFYEAGLSQTIVKLKTASSFWLVSSLLLYLVAVFVRAYRWQGLLEALDVKLGLGRLSWLYFIGFFFNQLVPTGIGGDAMRAYTLAKDGAGGNRATNSVLMDRATGLYSLLVMGTIALFLRPNLAPIEVILMLTGLTLGSTLGMLIFLWGARWINFERLPAFARNRFGRAFNKFYSLFGLYSTRSIVKALLVSIGFNIQLIITNVFLAKAFGVELSVWYFFLFVPLISTSLLFPSINGLGAREGAYVFLFGQVGVNKATALAMSLGFYGLNIVMALIGGLLLVLQSIRRTKIE